MKWLTLESKMLSAAAYDDSKQILYLRFRDTGHVYRYFDFPIANQQAFLNAGPLIVRGLQGAAAAGFIFNVLMLARAPLQLFQAVSTSILPHLTGLHASDEPGSEDEFHRSVRMVLIAVAAFFVAERVVLAGEHAKAELVAFKHDRWFGEVEAEFLEAAAARRDEDVGRRRLRDDGAVGGDSALRM